MATWRDLLAVVYQTLDGTGIAPIATLKRCQSSH